MSQLSFSRAGLAAVAVLAVFAFAAPGARAANLVVSEPGDPAVGPCNPGACSLRDAVEAADANTEADVITFAIATPALTRLAGTAINVDSADGITITGPGSGGLTITGDSNDNGPDAADSRIFSLGPGAVLSMSGVTLTEGRAAGGGAVLGAAGSALSISQSVLLGNRSLTDGGAVSTAGALILGDSTVSGNSADRGGGVSVIGGPAVIARSTVFFNTAAARGSGIAIDGVASGASVVVSASTIAENSGAAGAWGGGIFVSGALDGQLAIRDSTISGNAAAGGAGVSFGDFNPDSLIIAVGGSASLENSTVASNDAVVFGGGLYLSGYSGGGGPRVDLNSSIVGNNLAAGAGEDLDSAGVASGSVQASLSLVEAPGDALITNGPQGGNLLGVDPGLNALATNGGPTATHLPNQDSPVIDRGASRPGIATDQRGRMRPVDQIGILNASGGDGTDIGAVEIGPLPPPSLGFCRGEEVTILVTVGGGETLGTPGRDVILGTGDADEIRGLGGRDLICAAGGRDLVQAGGGDDTVLGSGGADRLFGEGGSDVMIGGDGKDRIGGSGGADRLFGLAGDDRLGGGGGPDGLYGHGGADELLGGGASDDLFGGPGRDRLVGGPRRDYLRGGPGRDAEIQ